MLSVDEHADNVSFVLSHNYSEVSLEEKISMEAEKTHTKNTAFLERKLAERPIQKSN